MTSRSAPSRRAHRVRKIILIGLILGVTAVAAAIAILLWTSSKVDREPVAGLDPVDGQRNILIVGTDSREDLPEDFEGNFGKFGGARTDVIMLVHFIPGERAQILSLPRDLKVTIPGGETNRINAAFAQGQGGLLVETIKFNLGIEINNYIEIDFAGFATIVDALGGVELTFDRPARDKKSGLDVDAGTQLLQGPQALAYARSRFYEEYRGGEWKAVRNNDIARTRRQQEVLLALFDQATSKGNALNLPGFAATVAEQIKTDETLTVGVMVELGRAALSLGSKDIEAMTLPVKIQEETRSDGSRISYVVGIEPDATAVLDAFKAGEPFPS
jgi:LCP family protein required for cell wall assembly